MSAWRFPAGRPGHGWVRPRQFPGRRMVFGLFLSGQVDVDVAKAVPSDAFGILSDIMWHRLTPLNGRSNGVEQPRHGEEQWLHLWLNSSAISKVREWPCPGLMTGPYCWGGHR